MLSEAVKDPLPSDLRKILRQVARNGRCSWLPWQRGDDQQLLVAKIRKVATHQNGKRKRPDTSGQSDRSGSEFEDSTHYECDSEGTSTTTNSELSADKRNKQQRRLQTTTTGANRSRYTSLVQAFATAIGLVLDNSYRTQGGYKMSPAEIRMYATAGKKLTPKEVFQQRRQRLIALVNHEHNGNGRRDGPPFTMQRMAEVLLAPDRYYKLTHKLCNCLEKLLMIRSSIQAFGGSTGGQTSQSRREVRMGSFLFQSCGSSHSRTRFVLATTCFYSTMFQNLRLGARNGSAGV
jgi:PPP4R2